MNASRAVARLPRGVLLPALACVNACTSVALGVQVRADDPPVSPPLLLLNGAGAASSTTPTPDTPGWVREIAPDAPAKPGESQPPALSLRSVLQGWEPPSDPATPVQPPSPGSPPASPSPAQDAPATDSAAPPSTGNAQNDANNPLTPKISLNLQDYYIPSFIGMPHRDANQLLLRGLVPEDLFGAPQLLRFTLPIAEVPTSPSGTDSGLGDLTLIDLFMFPGKEVSFGVGPLLVAPTASTQALGAGKWQAGAAGVVVAPQDWGILGGLVTFQQSFTGSSGREDVSLLTVQPLLLVNLPEGFYLRSTAIWNFDLNNGTYYLPVGFGAGKVWQVGGTTINLFAEPQYTLFHDGDGAPRWQIFMGINFQFSF